MPRSVYLISVPHRPLAFRTRMPKWPAWAHDLSSRLHWYVVPIQARVSLEMCVE